MSLYDIYSVGTHAIDVYDNITSSTLVSINANGFARIALVKDGASSWTYYAVEP